MKLNCDQQLLVEQNHGLIYWYANQRHLDLEEWYDILAIELCLTIMRYDSTKSSLSNYFKIRCDNRVNKEYTKQMTQKRKVEELVSYDEMYDIGTDGDVTDEMLGEYIDDIDELGILRLKSHGYTQAEIAHQLGVTQSFVSRKIKELKDRYYKGVE